MHLINIDFYLKVFMAIALCCVRTKQEVLIEESSSIETLHAGVGSTVELPCDVTPTLPNDSMGLVIWYKQGHDTPIYTFDKREGVMSYWSDPSTLSTRATFRYTTEPAVLLLTKLRPEDDGQYRCRVDFIRSPTKNTRLNLTILIPPEKLIILDQDGDEIKSGVIGPYDEGTDVNITCVAVGGRPAARVSWWKSHALLANSEARATVSFKLHRADYGSEVTCQAVTDSSLAPVSETLRINVNRFQVGQNSRETRIDCNPPPAWNVDSTFQAGGAFSSREEPAGIVKIVKKFVDVVEDRIIVRPLWVRLLGGKRPLVAGRRAELVCQAVGARPPPNISWWKGGIRLTTVRATTSSDGNVTNSMLSFVPNVDDAGRVISCRATQSGQPGSLREDGFQLEIQHVPVVKLELGANLDASNVVEGSDVYLDCMVRANPWHTQVYFTHNGVAVRGGVGVVVANQSLVLQRVSRRSAGSYVCVARNALGEGSSKPLVLDVKYSPKCRSDNVEMIRAGRGESVEILCDLDANPREPITYKWWFNSTTHSKFELDTYSAQEQSSLGRYVYIVNSSTDYGWVQCAGINTVGRQETPCLFHIIPAEKPSPVKNCLINNITHESLTLVCEAGHDGGLKQDFQLQVYDMVTGSVLRNLSSEEPQFAVWGLSSDVDMSVRAYNSKGSSEPFTLSSSLLKYPQRQTATIPVRVELTTVLVTVLCTVAGVVAVTAVSAFVFCWKYCQKSNDKHEKKTTKQEGILNTPLTDSKDCDSVDSLDKNPDIIPNESKIGDNCSTKSSATDYSAIRPLLSKTDTEKTDLNYEPNYNHNDHYGQYVQVRPMDFRSHQYHGLHMPNIGPSVHSFRPTLGAIPIGNECHSPCDKVYENWLKYKNSLPLNTSGLLPMEQCMPLEPCPPAFYGSINRNPMRSWQKSDLDPYSAECRSLASNYRVSPPVRVNMDSNSVHFSKSFLQQSSGSCTQLNTNHPSRSDVANVKNIISDSECR